ncbi:stalk domain-containing protein [Paenibacillus tarimensis]|uniref:stalk domain-containing protein n=1 Tax=Paenibacillus tarimensis TaxID=416012 RepID=UPI001F27A6DE|nr:stalk domain-containing protein [Paenibacillus tarimensis]MCF2946019.1 copper amine oxidase N-terminal domain-containing protein [Paenibacillus tarimensis]
MKKRYLVPLLIGLMVCSFVIGAHASRDVTLTINGVKSLSPVKVIEGTTYVPLREVAQMLNTNVTWDQKNQRITITSKNSEKIHYIRDITEDRDFIFRNIRVRKAQYGWDVFFEIENAWKEKVHTGAYVLKFYGKNKKEISEISGLIVNYPSGKKETVQHVTFDDLSKVTGVEVQMIYER